MPVPPPRGHDPSGSLGDLTLGFIADARALLRIRTLRWVIASATTMAFAAGALNAWLKDYLEAPSGKSMSQTASTELLEVALLGGLAGILVGGQVADRISRRLVAGRLWTIVLGMLLTVPFGIASLQLPPGIPLYISSIGTMFFISIYHAPMAATVDDLAPPGKTVAAQGLVIFAMHMLGTAPSSWIVGLILRLVREPVRRAVAPGRAHGRVGGLHGDGDAQLCRGRTALRYNERVRRLGVFVVVLAACSHGPGPGSTLDKYGRALKNHDYGAAYDLMSAGYRGKVSKDDYVRMMRDNPREVDETADRLRGKHGSMEVSAELVYGLGDQMRLVQEDGSGGSRPTRSTSTTSRRRRRRCARSSARTGSSAGT